jgi:hypothetical protein
LGQITGILWHEDEKEHAVRSFVCRKMVVRICFLALLSGVFSVAKADTVVLKGGQQLIGDILAEKEHLLNGPEGQDIGVQILCGGGPDSGGAGRYQRLEH